MNDFKQDIKIGDNPIAKGATLLGGLCGLGLTIMLYLTGRWRTGLLACPFGLVGIFAGIVLLVGFGMAITVKDPSWYKDAVCNTKMAGLNWKTGAEVARDMNLEFIDKLMCSDQCPCEADHHDIIEDDVDEKTLNKAFKRTWKEKPTDGLLPMKFGFEDDDKVKREFASFEECFNEEISAKHETPPNDVFKAAMNNYKKQVNKMRYYEEEFDCGGICDLPLFYITKPIAEGLPEEDCIDAIIESELDNKIIAGVNCGAGIIFILLGLASIPCGGKKKGKKEKHQELAEDPTAR